MGQPGFCTAQIRDHSRPTSHVRSPLERTLESLTELREPMSLTSAAIKRPVSTIAATLGIVLLGSVSLGRMPVSLLPDVTLPVLTIRTLYADAAATEVSRFVAEPIERAVAATPGLVELRSVSRNGEATTTLRFAWGTNMQGTLLNV